MKSEFSMNERRYCRKNITIILIKHINLELLILLMYSTRQYCTVRNRYTVDFTSTVQVLHGIFDEITVIYYLRYSRVYYMRRKYRRKRWKICVKLRNKRIKKKLKQNWQVSLILKHKLLDLATLPIHWIWQIIRR